METKFIIPPKSGYSLELRQGQLLKVVCPEGGQVADMVAFNRHDLTESLSNGKTFDYEQTLRLTTGNRLYSNLSNSMLEIIEDSCGIHDFLLAPCCPETMRRFYKMEGPSPNCRDNLYEALAGYGIGCSQIPTAFNIFMNVAVDSALGIEVLPPVARAGDYVTFRAGMDLIVGITACSAGASNHYTFSPIEVQVEEMP